MKSGEVTVDLETHNRLVSKNADLRRQLEEAKAELLQQAENYREMDKRDRFADLQAEVERLNTVISNRDDLHSAMLEAACEEAERLREKATKVVDALDDTCGKGYCMMVDAYEAIADLRAALAQPESEQQDEPDAGGD